MRIHHQFRIVTHNLKLTKSLFLEFSLFFFFLKVLSKHSWFTTLSSFLPRGRCGDVAGSPQAGFSNTTCSFGGRAPVLGDSCTQDSETAFLGGDGAKLKVSPSSLWVGSQWSSSRPGAALVWPASLSHRRRVLFTLGGGTLHTGASFWGRWGGGNVGTQGQVSYSL